MKLSRRAVRDYGPGVPGTGYTGHRVPSVPSMLQQSRGTRADKERAPPTTPTRALNEGEHARRTRDKNAGLVAGAPQARHPRVGEIETVATIGQR